MSLPKVVLDDLDVVTGIKYVNFIASSIWLYDFLLTLPDEIRFIWRWEWRAAGKTFYLISRYNVLFDLIIFHVFWFKSGLDAKTCEHIFNAGAWTIHAGIILSQWILAIRTYAIWGHSRIMLGILVVHVLGTEIPSFFILQDLLKRMQWSLSPFPTIAKCNVVIPPNNLFVNYAIVAISEFVIVVLTVWRAVSQRTKNNVTNGLLGILYRDGIIFFACLFAISVTNFVLQADSKLPPLYIFLLPELQHVLHSVLTSKIILHLREYTLRDHILSRPTFDTVPDMSLLRFRLDASAKTDGTGETESTTFELSTRN